MRSDKYTNSSRKKIRGISLKSIFLILILIVAIIVGFIIYNYVKGAGYKDAESFEKFVTNQFSYMEKSNDDSVKMKEYSKYGEKRSVAYRLPMTGNELIDNRVKEIKKDLVNELNRYDRAKYKEPDNNLVKTAYLTGYSISESDKLDTESILIKTQCFEQREGEKLEMVREMVYPINYTKDTGLPIGAMNVFEGKYRDVLSEVLTERVEDDYSKTLTEDYTKYLSSKTQSFENFVLSDDKVEFVFNSNTISTQETAAIVKISNGDISDICRDEINLRVLDPSKPMVALTFDDGPAAGKTEKLLDILKENGAKATFFELGKNINNMRDSDKVLKRMLEEGNELGSHSYDHPNLFTMTDKEVKEQVDKTNEAIMNATGQLPTVYRPPFGNGNEKITKIFNVPGVLWTVDTEDWKSRNASSVESIVKNSGNLDGKVILMHSIYDSSVQAAEELIPWMTAKGYQLVTVSELLTYKYNQNPADVKFYGYGYFSGPKI